MQPEPLVTFRGVAYPWHCDHMGHMNVTWYVSRFDEATWNLFASVGLTPSYVRDANCGMVAVEQHISYKRELLAGDVVFARSRWLEGRERVVRFAHELINGETGEVAAVTELTGVHLDRATRKSVALPSPVLARIHAALAPLDTPSR